MKTALLLSLFVIHMALPSVGQLCPGGGVNFSSAVTFDPSWIYGCNTGTSCNGGIALDNRIACLPVTLIDACAPAPSCGNPLFNASNVWFKFNASATTATISCFQNTSLIIGIQAFSGGPACGSLTELGCVLAGGPSSGAQLHLSGLTIGKLYYFRIFGSASPVSQRTGLYCFCGTTGLSGALLPATITGFNGQLTGNQITLGWKSPSAGANTLFELERSTDGSSFTPLGHITGSGSTGVYTYTDAQPAKGINYYRVKQAAAGVGDSYSEIVRVNAGLPGAFSLKVNPGRRELQVAVSSYSAVLLYDMAGKVLQAVHLQAGNNTLSLGQWPAGIYFIRAAQGGAAQKFFLRN